MLRRKGYLKFYRKMKNVRRVPFITVSIGKRGIGYGGEGRRLGPILILIVCTMCTTRIELSQFGVYIIVVSWFL